MLLNFVSNIHIGEKTNSSLKSSERQPNECQNENRVAFDIFVLFCLLYKFRGRHEWIF